MQFTLRYPKPCDAKAIGTGVGAVQNRLRVGRKLKERADWARKAEMPAGPDKSSERVQEPGTPSLAVTMRRRIVLLCSCRGASDGRASLRPLR